jgi:GT2 family glycosyltransferase
MKKIAVCIPIKGSVHDTFFLNLVTQMLKNSRDYDLFVVSSTRMPLDAARNEILQIAMKNSPDYLWWLDSDMVLPQNINVLQSLIDMDKDMTSALYFRREYPYHPVFIIVKDGRPCVVKPLPIRQILKVDAVGMGCLLVKKKVFEELMKSEEPVFEFKQKIFPESVETMGEDINFCLKAKKLGFEIYLNSNIVCGHIGSTVIDEKIYFKYMD